MITRILNENSTELYSANRKIDMLSQKLKRQTTDTDRDGSCSTRYNRSFASDHSVADVRIMLTT